MKKIILSSLVAAAAAMPAFAGVDNINYQAVIKNGNNVVANEKVELKFELLDNAEKVVYSEEQTPTTNDAGYVACQLGKEDALSTLEWGDLTLRVSINLGSGYQVLSTEAVSSVPTALYALRSADSDMIKEAVEELMIDNESNKTSILGINAALVKYEGFIEDQDAFNTELVEKIEPMMGLNYEEINDFHERVSEALINLQNSSDELSTSTEAAFEMLEPRLDKMQKQIDAADTTAEENYMDLKGSIFRINESLGALQGKVNEDIEALSEQVEAAFDMNQTVIDKIQKQADTTDQDLENIKENLTNAFEVKDAEIAEINGQLENLNNVAAVVRANEEGIEQLTEQTDAFATMVETRFDKIQNQVDLIDPEVEKLVEANEETQNDIKNMKADVAQIEGLAQKVENIENELDFRNEDSILHNIMQMGEAFSQVEETVEGLVQENENTQNDIKNMKADLAQIEGLSQKVENLEASVAAILDPTGEEPSYLMQISEALGQMQEQIDVLKAEIDALKGK